MKPLTLAHNAVTAKLVDAPREVRLFVQQLLSYQVDGFEHMTSVSGSKWNGRASFFEFSPATFPAGFVSYVYVALRRAGHAVNLVRKPLPLPLGPVNPKVDDFPEDPRYDYQGQVVEKLLRHGQIIAQVATGGGKSRIAKLCHARIGRPTLFLTTRGILMHQMRDAFVRDMGARVGVYGDDQWSANPARMNVGMVQTFMARLKDGDPRRDETIALLAGFEFVILEEAHEASGNSYYEIMRHCRNAHYRLALTATPFMKESEEANMRLQASSGPIAIKVTERLLIDRGILATPYFKYIPVPPPAGLYKSTPWQKAYELGVVKCPNRNGAIVREVATAVEHGLSAMVLVQQTEHGHILSSLLTAAGVRCNFIKGAHSQKEREAAILALKERRIDALIGSTILDVGVDVPAVGLVAIASGGKAEVALRQRIGRGLREKRDGGPNVAFIVDFTDSLNNHLRGHALQRRAIIEATDGFAQGVLVPGADFPYARLGFKRGAKAA